MSDNERVVYVKIFDSFPRLSDKCEVLSSGEVVGGGIVFLLSVDSTVEQGENLVLRSILLHLTLGSTVEEFSIADGM